MKKKDKKPKLECLSVESFMTQLDYNSEKTIHGGGPTGILASAAAIVKSIEYAIGSMKDVAVCENTPTPLIPASPEYLPPCTNQDANSCQGPNTIEEITYDSIMAEGVCGKVVSGINPLLCWI